MLNVIPIVTQTHKARVCTKENEKGMKTFHYKKKLNRRQ